MHGIQDNHDEFFNNIQSNPKSSKIEFTKVVESHTWRRKRGFFSSFQIPAPIIEFIYDDDDKNGAEDTTVTSDAEVTTTATSGLTATAANVNAAYKSFLDAFQSSKETHIVAIGPDVDKSLVEAAPYLPLVNKLTTYIMPDLSLRDVVTLSLNVAVLTTQGAADNANAQVIGDQVRVYFIILCINYRRKIVIPHFFNTTHRPHFQKTSLYPYLLEKTDDDSFWLHY